MGGGAEVSATYCSLDCFTAKQKRGEGTDLVLNSMEKVHRYVVNNKFDGSQRAVGKPNLMSDKKPRHACANYKGTGKGRHIICAQGLLLRRLQPRALNLVRVELVGRK